MIALLDINVLIARADPAHVFHERAVSWMASLKNASIATCPLTENGFLRIYGNPVYPEGPGSPAAASPMLAAIRRLPQHVFLPDDISLSDTAGIPTLVGVGHSQLTDLYLLALAVRHSAVFATFDRRVDPAMVIGGSDALLVIP
jgi:toxin-antitoxin system PIN domain toxin